MNDRDTVRKEVTSHYFTTHCPKCGEGVLSISTDPTAPVRFRCYRCKFEKVITHWKADWESQIALDKL